MLYKHLKNNIKIKVCEYNFSNLDIFHKTPSMAYYNQYNLRHKISDIIPKKTIISQDQNIGAHILTPHRRYRP